MDRYWEQFKTPFLCFAGYSGVGKTTLLERLIHRFSDENFTVGYYKHDAHRFTVDKEGKDTWRADHAGAGIVVINDPAHFAIVGDDNYKKRTITHALEQCDCILIEGYKQSPFDKIVFLDAEGKLPIPLDTPGIKAVIHQGTINDNRIETLGIPLFHRDEADTIFQFVKTHFHNCASPIYGALFVGGQSKRMGQPKFSIEYNGVTETERMIQLLKKSCSRVFISSRSDLEMHGEDDQPGIERINDDHIGLGPVGGLATLMGRFPEAAWLIVACDMPFLNEKNFETIIRERDPLRYGTCFVKKSGQGFEPMCAIYEPKFILPLFEAMSRQELSLSRIIDESPFKQVKIPDNSRTDFMNTNTPEEYEIARSKREQENLKL